MNYLARQTQLLWVGLALLLIACSPPPPPIPGGYSTILVEVEPSAVAAILTETELTGTPTTLIELVASPLAATTSEASPSPQANPTATISATVVSAEPTRNKLTITSPVRETRHFTGSDLRIAGYVEPGTAVFINIQLIIGPYTLIDEATQSDADSGEWELTVPIPHSVEGIGKLIVRTETETAIGAIQLVYDGDQDETGISIDVSRPGDGQMAVAGHQLFFEGVVTNAIDSTITVGLYTDNCTMSVARQSFTLGAADASWNGVINLPATLNGRSCAFVSTGSSETGVWREILIWLPVIHPDEEGVFNRIILGNSLKVPFKAGENVYLFGSVIDAAGQELLIRWFAEDGVMLMSEGTAVIDALGFWETNIPLPADAFGTTVLQLQFEDDGETITNKIDIIVDES